SAAKQCAVSAQRDEAVEAGCALERRRGRRRPEGGDAVFGEEGEAEARRRLREVREQVLEVAVARVADDPDVHEGASDSSVASASAASRAGWHITPTASRAQSFFALPARSTSQLPYGMAATSAAGGASPGALSRG